MNADNKTASLGQIQGSSDETLRIVDAAREVWIRRLIDHSRANSLLFYRDLKVGTLEITQQEEALRRLLAGDTLRVKDLLPRLSGDAERDPARRERELLEARNRIQHALIAIQRKALGNLEEKGIETLFLALGMATWPAADGGRPYDAPVLLVPARIENRSREEDDLRLIVAGEPQLNPVLVYVLESALGIRIAPEVILETSATENEAGDWTIDPEGVFDQLEREARSVPDFSVRRRAILGNFQFAKMAMVEDLRRNGEALAENRVVAAIAGHAESRRELAMAVADVDPIALDERKAGDDYLVLNADSTQQRAIVLVCRGQNGVIQGPPGTGKSQTIANLIAQSIAEGKRVLFVAEKRAALDAVIKRLNHPAVNLGHLVLDMHGASVLRKEVMGRLASSLEQIRYARPVGSVDLHREFEERRQQLNEHSRRINQSRSPTELSINQMLGRLLRLPGAAKSSLRLRGEGLENLIPERFDQLRQRILDAAVHSSLVLGIDPSPWNNADIRDGRSAQSVLDHAAKIANDLWPRLEERFNALLEQIAVTPPETMDGVGKVLGVLRDVRRVRERYAEEIFNARPGELAACLAAAESGTPKRLWALLTDPMYRSARARLRSLRNEPASDSVLLRDARHAAEVLRRWRELGPADAMPREAEKLPEVNAAWTALCEALHSIEQVTSGGAFGAMTVGDARLRIKGLAEDQRTPYRLPGVYDVRNQLQSAGLTRLLDDFRDQAVPPDQWTARFEYVWLHSALDSVLATDPALASFNGRAHEQIVADFVRLDEERLRLAAERVRRLAAERAIQAMDAHYEQADLVRKEVSKRSRHIPLRQLFVRAPDVLTRIAPCWVASPLSVSQLLDGGHRHFDLVVFDEASQILQEEAVPAVYRAGQVVVAGDRHQLPPTTFFATVVEGEDDIVEDDEVGRRALETATAAIGGFESLLDTLEAFLPNWMLEWHYRSEDERLIAFSNEHIYRRLITFPSARDHDAIKHVLVPHDPALGTQEESASREVDEVVRLALQHAESRPRESLGVIAMGIKHANRVQAALDRAVELRPALADYFALEKEERFFVKNLETVQGDERDAIILTIGYGKTANGDLPHRFGPLTQDTGYRRLNVAVTRARKRVIVISSFSHHEVDLDRSRSRGVQLLKLYLEYAASGGTRLPQSETSGEVPLNAFEADIRDALEARGIRTRAQFGVSKYRIDLVAMHPEKHGRPVLAIECDGASYHSSATARDRDRLRQQHLMRLGWRFHRIWSTDWFFGREPEIERAVTAYEEAVRHADLVDADRERPTETRSVQVPERASHPSSTPSRLHKPVVPIRQSIDQYSDRELRQLVEWVTSDGILRTEEELIREAFAALPFDRLGPRIRSRLEGVVQEVRRGGL
jgi:very-short-patch-repair endonuclease